MNIKKELLELFDVIEEIGGDVWVKAKSIKDVITTTKCRKCETDIVNVELFFAWCDTCEKHFYERVNEC